MLVETKQRLEKLQKLLKAEKIQPVSAKRAAELFKKVFTTIQDSVKGLSKFRKKYPKYFKTITQEGARSVEGNKLRAYLEKINKNLTEDLSTSSTELNKKAKTNLKVGTVFNIVKTFNENKQNKFILRGTTGTSDIDPIYANSKKFKEYYDNLENYPKFEEAKSYQKKNAHKAFLRRASSKIDPNFPLTTEEFVNKIGGIKAKTIPSYVVSTGNRRSSIGDYIQENFSYKRRGGAELRWKDPSDTSLRKWNRFLNSRIINKTTVDNVQTLYDDKNIYKAIFEDKRLPQLDEVQKVLKTKSPSIAAYAMSILARKLKGEEFKTDINIPKNTVAGKRILNQIGDLGIRDAYRSAFYSAALSNVDSYYKNQGATSLRQFKTDFNNELKTLLSLGKDQKVPFSVNEVIGISTGEMRGLQPYSAFVDITERNINEKALAQYQGKLSRKIGEIQDIFADSTLSEAEKVTRAQAKADILKNTEGFKDLTKAQKDSLGLAEIKIGTEIDPNVFSKEQLARYKTKGLDIQAITDREGFYVDPKGRKPFFEVSSQSLKNAALKAAKTNEGNICQLFRKDGGRIGFAAGGGPGCVEQMSFAFDDDPVKLSQDINKLPDERGPINKVKNAATKFLQSPMLRGAGKYGAIAAGGAVAAGFVKQFMNDDPTTYLSNEEQQKNLLMDMVTGSLDDTPEESPAIGDAYLPALGGTLAAGTAVTAPSTIKIARSGALGAKKSGITKTALKTLGKGLAATTTPLGLLATEPLYLAEQVQQGDSLGEIATNPFNYFGAAFASDADRIVSRGLNPTIAKTMRLGISPTTLKTVSRRFGLPGLALSLGISGYETYDDFKNKRGFFSNEE